MLLRKSLLVAGVILACGMGIFPAFAQEPQRQTPPAEDGAIRRDRIERLERRRARMGDRMARGHRGKGRHGGQGRLMRELNLTEEQRQQGRAIMQRRLESSKLQREELFKLRENRIAGRFTAEDEARANTLRQEIRTAMEGVRTEMAGVLTPEQRAKLEELQKERREKMEQRLEKRQQRLNNKPM